MNALRALLPALIPSWRFFDTIGPAPRIEYARIANDDLASAEWVVLRPLPRTLPFAAHLRSLLWNPGRNDTLYLLGCCERVLEHASPHAIAEIRARIEPLAPAGPLVFRIVETARTGGRIESHVAYVSEPWTKVARA